MANDIPRRPAAWLAVFVGLAAGGWAGYQAYAEQAVRTTGLDHDGWGHLVWRMKKEGRDPAALVRDPSLWKGPVVPTVFGLAYLVYPDEYSVLAANAVFTGLAAGLLVRTFQRYGAPAWASAAAVLAWIAYPPHWMVYGYYFAEPFLALLSGGVFALTARALDRPSAGRFLGAGLLGGVLVLARAPFGLVLVGACGLIVLRRPGGRWLLPAAVFSAGVLAAFLPWGVRNYLVEGAYVPTTTEGGMILFQGTYLPGDDGILDDLRKMPEYKAIEAEGRRQGSEVEQYKWWQARAVEQIKADPAGQLRLCVRKAMRFWVYLPAGSWTPTLKSEAVAAVALPLAAVGLWAGRRSLLVQLSAVWTGGLWLFYALVHCELRYNYPVLPMLFLLSALGAQRLLAGVRGGRPAAGETVGGNGPESGRDVAVRT